MLALNYFNKFLVSHLYDDFPLDLCNIISILYALCFDNINSRPLNGNKNILTIATNVPFMKE